mmetsp:Transcript_54320/g.140289  ORF Transcript_54320/g.140289 Transcript_54320/m.140289 type:complete len:324 (-) Transcript_54320:249-1220(-)
MGWPYASAAAATGVASPSSGRSRGSSKCRATLTVPSMRIASAAGCVPRERRGERRGVGASNVSSSVSKSSRSVFEPPALPVSPLLADRWSSPPMRNSAPSRRRRRSTRTVLATMARSATELGGEVVSGTASPCSVPSPASRTRCITVSSKHSVCVPDMALCGKPGSGSVSTRKHSRYSSSQRHDRRASATCRVNRLRGLRRVRLTSSAATRGDQSAQASTHHGPSSHCATASCKLRQVLARRKRRRTPMLCDSRLSTSVIASTSIGRAAHSLSSAALIDRGSCSLAAACSFLTAGRSLGVDLADETTSPGRSRLTEMVQSLAR